MNRASVFTLRLTTVGRACNPPSMAITVLKTCRALRDKGIRLAIDDAGSGYASFRHILSLEPDFIKLDMSMIRGIDADPRRQALIAAFTTFARKTQSELIAEGVETIAEVETLKLLGLTKAQGYLLGTPGPLPQHA